MKIYLQVYKLLYFITTLSLCIYGYTAQAQNKNNSGSDTHHKFKSKIKLSNIHFDTTADFSNSYFDSLANFDSSAFYNADFASSTFDSANFRFCTFRKKAKFKNVQIGSYANFVFAHFYSLAIFDSAHFQSVAEFKKVIFDSIADFSNVRFDSTALFNGASYGAKFYGEAKFKYAFFHSKAEFNGAYFKSSADFKFCRFHSIANYNYAHFHSDTYFRGIRFDSVADFSFASIDTLISFRFDTFYIKLDLSHLRTVEATRLDFSRSILPDTIDLSFNPYLFYRVPLSIDFTLCNFSPTKTDSKKIHWINLYNTDISKIKIDYTHFRLYFKDISENNKELSADVKESIYQQLLKNFKERGQDESYEQLDIEYKRYNGGKKTLGVKLQDWWWLFGYEKWRVILYAIGFILLFSFINFFLMPKLNNKTNGAYYIDSLPEFLPRKYYKNTRRFFWRRVGFTILYTSIIFLLLTIKVEKMKFSKPIFMWVLFIHGIGLVCVGFLVNYILQK